MTGEEFNGIAARVASRMLEETAFVFTEPWDDAPAFDGEFLTARIEYEGPQTGTVAVAAEPAFCTSLASNFLGLEPGEPEAEQKGFAALGEILNIITGALMEEWFGTDEICHIGIPKLLTETHHRFMESFPNAFRAVFRDDEGCRFETFRDKKMNAVFFDRFCLTRCM